MSDLVEHDPAIESDGLENGIEPITDSTATTFKVLISGYSYTRARSRLCNDTKSQTAASSTASSEPRIKLPLKRNGVDNHEGATAASPSKRSRIRMTSASPSPKKTLLSYAPPETYAHLNVLHDFLKPGLDSEQIHPRPEA